ncbi:MAG: right-handed parallel beta-helix repeat-containing protein [Lachnospiraceae bacterium]|nr:right-handed parallel beta-helix repeat-containing protein [Lachnospiraceae bacterium]
MKKFKKVLIYVLILTMVAAAFVVGEPKKAKAAGSYLIKAADSDKYLYAAGGKTMAGSLDESNKAFYWTLLSKGNNTYWIQNKADTTYMCLENQKNTSGIVELSAENYDAWESSKWVADVNSSTTIKNVWKGNNGYVSISGADVVFGSKQQSFNFIGKAYVSEESVYVPTGGVAESINIPGPDSDLSSIGATMPYIRYESDIADLGGGAVIASSANFAKNNIASQASNQSYIRLPQAGSYAEWTVVEDANGVTMRFTMPDSADGMGLKGSLDVYVNDTKVKTVDLTSYYMWQYFTNKALADKAGSNSTACFAFDEVHFLLDTPLAYGDKLKIMSTGANGLEYGVDFLELEKVGAPIAKPENAYDITDFGAIPNDGKNDLPAINSCVAKAQADGKDVYIPAGTFNIGRMWRLSASDMKITGAGIWYTNIQFTNSAKSMGGISGNVSNVEFCNMYLNSNLRSRYNEAAVYKCFMDNWAGASYIHDIWEDHFECGFWIADYSSPFDYSDGLKIVNCRIRNNLADGVNFSQGTSHSVVYNCDVRNNGDDGLAMYDSKGSGCKDENDNTFCYNTIEFNWRAGGIAVYGGNDHKIYNNYIADTFMSAGIHANTVFEGYKFLNNDNGIVFENHIIKGSGTSSDAYSSDLGAVDIMGDVRNLEFNNTYIYDSQHDAVRISGNPSDVVFNNLQGYGTGLDGTTTVRTNTGALVKFDNTTVLQSMNNIKYANIKYPGIFFRNRNAAAVKGETDLGSDYPYKAPIGTLKLAPKLVIPDEPETEEPTQESTGDNEIPFEEESSEPETEAPTEPETEEPTEPETEAPTEPETEAPTEPETEAPTEPETEAPTEPETEAPTEPETEAPTEPETEAPTEPETEAPTEPETEAPTEPETEAPTEPETEAPTEPETEAPTEPETEAPTEPETEAPTEPETEAPSEPETEAPSEPETEAPSEPETEAPSEPETEAPSEPEAESEGETQTEVSTEGATEGATAPQTVPESSSAAPVTPSTGDAAPVTVAILLCLLSAVVVFTTLFTKRRHY